MSSDWDVDNAVEIFDSDIPVSPVLKRGPSGCHPSPEKRMGVLLEFALSVVIPVGLIAMFTSLFYWVSLFL